jgi:hypothetical protein
MPFKTFKKTEKHKKPQNQKTTKTKIFRELNKSFAFVGIQTKRFFPLLMHFKTPLKRQKNTKKHKKTQKKIYFP